jgi:multidrug efflux pump subunit AcrA (membrane-fusion protein)
VKVKVSVPEAEMSAITPHTPSMIIVEAAGKKVSGGRIEKGVVADAMTHTYDIRINVPNGDRKLLPGMVAQVRMRTQNQKPTPALPRGGSLNTPSNDDATNRNTNAKANQSPLPSGGEGGGFYLPITSVQRRPDGSLFVWTVDNQKKAHRTAVTIGASQGNRICIMSGVTAGQRVVTEGYQKLSEGTEVRF